MQERLYCRNHARAYYPFFNYSSQLYTITPPGFSIGTCHGDSGGPLFTGAPGSPTDQLIATVDLGHGCGQNGFPGIYQSVVQHQNRAFLTSNPPQAPYQPAGSTPNILGTAQPGQTLTCQAGPWVG